MNSDKVLLRIDGDIGILTINDPPSNFLEEPEFIRLDTLKNWIGDNHLKGVVITGTGRHFSGGASLDKLFSESFTGEISERMKRGSELLQYISDLPIPVYAAVTGVCFGGGLEIALACDVRVCNSKALFAFPEVTHNLMPGLGGISMVSAIVPKADAIRLSLGGDMISAAEAKQSGIADIITDDPAGYSVTLLKKITSERSLKVINFIMTAIHNTGILSVQDALREETRMFCELAMDEYYRRKKSS